MTSTVHPLIMNELQRIERASIPTPYHTWSCLIHVDGKNYRMPIVNQVAVKRDYLGNVSDVFKVAVKCDAAMYNTIIYPNRDKLKVTLSRRPNYVKGSGDQFDALYQVEQYIARLVDTSSSNMVGENPFTNSKASQNQHSLVDFEMQITSSVVARLRNMNYGTNHTDTSAIEVIRTILTHFTVEGGDREGERVKGVDVADNYSTAKREQISIPHDASLLDVPALVDRYSDSVYPTGFGYYLQNGLWYIFSPYDLKRYERGQYTRSLTVINVASFQFPGIEKTYRNTGTQVIIVANGETKQFDATEHNAMNEGTGGRFVDAERSNAQLSTYNGGKAEFSPTEYMNEFSVLKRESGMSKLTAGRSVTGNPRNEYGKLAKRQGSFIGVIWDLSAPDLLYPGMPIKYVYVENGMPKSVYGTLVDVDSKDSPANENVSSVIFSTTSYLTLFVERT